MPKEVPDWFNGRKLTFPQAPPNSLRLLGHVVLEASDLARSGQFFIEVLGGGSASACPPGGASEFRLQAGASEIKVVAAQGGAGAEVRTWPGHVYLWVQDIRATLDRCRALEKKLGVKLVEEEHNITAADIVDAIVLQDPDGNRFVVNQAPKGFVDRISRLGVVPSSGPSPNVLALIEAVHSVPPGGAPAMARFCHHYFGAPVSPKDAGWAVHFSPGRALRQTLCFVDDAGLDAIDENESTASTDSPLMSSVCMYMPSKETFRKCFEKCEADGIVDDSAGGWEEVERSGEFRVRRCMDPKTHKVVMELECVVRAPDHSACLLPPRQEG